MSAIQEAIDILKRERDRLDAAIAALSPPAAVTSPLREAFERRNNAVTDKPKRAGGRRGRGPKDRECSGCGRMFDAPGFGNHMRHGKCPGKPNGAAKPEPPQATGLRCECGETFENARALGVHKTRTHYTGRSMTGSQLAR